MKRHATMRLSELCDLVTLQVDPKDQPDGLYLGLEHLAPARLEAIGGGTARDVESTKSLFERGDVLYGKLRPYLDKAVLAPSHGICSTEILVLRPRRDTDPRFLLGVVHSPLFVQHAVAGTTGAHHPRTSWNHIANFELAAFGALEQSSIGNLLWSVHEAIDANEMLIVSGEALKRATMSTLFGGGLRNEPRKDTEIGLIPESWAVSTLGEVATLERGRFLHRPRNEPRFYGGQTPFVQTGDVVRSGGRIRTFSQSLNQSGVQISRVFPAGTILITIAANIGYSGILEFESACPDSLVGITPKGGVDTQFLEYWLQAQQRDMDQRAPKGTQKNINIQFLRPWPVAVPSMDEQREIAEILSTLDRKIELHQQKRSILDDLFKSLLHKLMTGEIRVADLDLSVLKSTSKPEVAA